MFLLPRALPAAWHKSVLVRNRAGDGNGRRLVLLLPAVLTFAVAAVLGGTNAGAASAATTSTSANSTAGSSSAVSSSAAGTRVGASTTDLILFVGGQASIAAGQGRGDGLSQSQVVVGRCVAAEDSSSVAEDIANGHVMTSMSSNGASTQESRAGVSSSG